MAVVRYLVNDIERALPFYLALGFTEVERWGPPFVIVQKDDLQLWLSGPGTSASKPMPDGSTPSPGGWNRLVIQVEDLDAAISSLKANGATFRSPPVAGPGGRQVLANDPSGNPIELYEAK